MSTQYYLPDTDDEKVIWLKNFAEKLPVYATTFSIDAGTVSQTTADDENFEAIITSLKMYKQYNKNVTAYKNHLRDGAENNVAIGAFVSPPAPPSLSSPIVGDVFGRIRKLAQTIKNNPNYTDTIGKNLGIIGAETMPLSSTEKAALKPQVEIYLKSGHPAIKWVKGSAGSIKIMVDRGTGTYALLAIATESDYLDIATLPPVGQTAVWKYMLIYMEHDEEMGQWSNVVSITVMGTP